MSRKFVIRWVVFFAALVIMILGGIVIASNQGYYRGIYDGCIMSFQDNGVITEFDLIVCQSVEKQARRERWNSIDFPRPSIAR